VSGQATGEPLPLDQPVSAQAVLRPLVTLDIRSG
jgi:hypothetical protein